VFLNQKISGFDLERFSSSRLALLLSYRPFASDSFVSTIPIDAHTSPDTATLRTSRVSSTLKCAFLYLRQALGPLMSNTRLDRAGETSREIRLVSPMMQEVSGTVVLSE
jgi:hypothetical protein